MDYKLNIRIKNKLDGMKDVSGIERQSVKVGGNDDKKECDFCRDESKTECRLKRFRASAQ